MIKYHGTPIGGTKQDAVRALMGRHGLVSYAHPKDMATVAEVCQSFVLDNGAFSIWRQGGRLDVEGYIRWCYEWYRHPRFDWAIIPDAIEGDAEDNDELLDQWPSDIKGSPVWHPHESIDRLTRLAFNWEVVCLGGSDQYPSIGSENWWRRMSVAMDAVCDSQGRPYCKLHGLRLLDPKIFEQMPLSSADSTNIARNNNQLNRFGMYKPPTAGQRAVVIASRIESHNSAHVWDRHDQLDMFSPSQK